MSSWIKIRQQLYQKIRSQVEALSGNLTSQVGLYSAQYEKEFRQRWSVSDRHELFKSIQDSDIVFVGDFHALSQSQKSQLRILKGISDKKDVILAVEFFERRHQKHIDKYMSGDLSEKDFLKAIKWHYSWGFPWENFRPLIRWAQKKKIRVEGLNLYQKGRSNATLRRRDKHAAVEIVRIKRKNPGALVFVIFGDLHLASGHLPFWVRREAKRNKINPKLTTVFQNSEYLFFKTLERGIDLDVIRLAQDRYCLLNVPPWVKWQNYLLYLENQLDQEIREESDYQDEVENYLKILQHDLGVKIPSGNYSVATAADHSFWAQVSARYDQKQQKFIQNWVEKSMSFYLPEMQTAFLVRPTVNHAAQLAASILHSTLSKQNSLVYKFPEDFQKMIWLETTQYFGSKLINPKRKTDTLSDLKIALSAKIPSDQGKEALQLALQQKMNDMLILSGAKKVFPLRSPRKSSSVQEASRLLGGMLGEKLYSAFSRGALSQQSVAVLLSRSIEIPNFSLFYNEVVELIEVQPDPFLSKTHKL